MADIDLEALSPFAAERAAVRLLRAAAGAVAAEADGGGGAGAVGGGAPEQVREPAELAAEVPGEQPEHAVRAHGLPQELYQKAEH